MEFRSTTRIGYDVLKGWNIHEYSGWHWNKNQMANATQADPKQDGENISI
jgi:hypothetical protein